MSDKVAAVVVFDKVILDQESSKAGERVNGEAVEFGSYEHARQFAQFVRDAVGGVNPQAILAINADGSDSIAVYENVTSAQARALFFQSKLRCIDMHAYKAANKVMTAQNMAFVHRGKFGADIDAAQLGDMIEYNRAAAKYRFTHYYHKCREMLQ